MRIEKSLVFPKGVVLHVCIRLDNRLRLCLHIDTSCLYFLLFSVVFLVSPTDDFFISKVHVDLLSSYLCVIFQIRMFQVFLFYCYCKTAVKGIMFFFSLCRAVQYEMVYVFFLVQVSTSHTVSFFVFVSIFVVQC